MSDTKGTARMRISLDDLRQYDRDVLHHGQERATILLFVRTNYNGRNLTVTDLAVALGYSEVDTYEWVLSLVVARRLQWSVITPDRYGSRVRAA